MTPDTLANWLGALPLAERARALNLISFKLTIHGRDYPEDDSAAKKKLVGINELQHKLSAQAGHYLDGEESTAYPVDVFSQALFQSADHYGIPAVLNAALESAVRQARGEGNV